MSVKREDIQLDLQEDHRPREDREAKSRILCCVTENQGLGLEEGSTTFKIKKNMTVRAGASNVEAPFPNDTEKNTKQQHLTN
jgi:hypothetical protein